MRVLITGINGLLGKDIAKVFAANKDYEVYGTGRAVCLNPDINYRKADLTVEKEINSILDEIEPELIIHCAAYTKLDDCEKNQEYNSWAINRIDHVMPRTIDQWIAFDRENSKRRESIR